MDEMMGLGMSDEQREKAGTKGAVSESPSLTGCAFEVGDEIEHWRYKDEWHGKVMGFENGRVRVMVPGSKKGLLFWPQNMRKKA